VKTVDATWRNLAKGYEKACELELSLQHTWKPQVQKAQQQKYQADLDAWNSRQEQRMSEHQRALSSWTQTVADQRLQLRTTIDAGICQARVSVPVSVLLLAVAGLLGVVDLSVVQLIFFGVCIGLAIAFKSAVWSAIEFVQLQVDKPLMNATDDPRPEQGEPIRLALVDHWWRQISDDGTYQSKATVDHGDVGEENFFDDLKQSLPDDHVSIRNIVVKRGLDVDVLVVGPTNVWVFEVKHWSGTISCRNGNWRRFKPYYAPGGVLRHEEQEIKSFDRQWMRERREVEETLRRRVHPSHLANRIAGGLVFTHPNVTLDIDQSHECGYGPPAFWSTHLRKVAAGQQEIISQQSQLKIMDALLDRAERIDDRYAQRYCCIELAERIAFDLTEWAQAYVARHASP
jgi:hypothetical protein